MVTEKEMAERVFVKPKEMQGTSSYVTAGEMKRFEQNKELNNDVYERSSCNEKRQGVLD